MDLVFVIKHASVWKYKSKKYHCQQHFTMAIICLAYLPLLFAMAIWCNYMLWQFVVATCCWNLAWLLVMGIYGSYRLWEYTDAILHTNLLWLFGRYAETFYFFFFHNEKYFFNLGFSFAYLMAVMHHCKKEIITRKKIFKNDILQSNIFFLPFFFFCFFFLINFISLLSNYTLRN